MSYTEKTFHAIMVISFTVNIYTTSAKTLQIFQSQETA